MRLLHSRKTVVIFSCGWFCGVLLNVVFNGRNTDVPLCDPKQLMVDQRPSQNHTITRAVDEESLYHNDDASVAMQLTNKVRILCWVLTTPEGLWTKAIYIKETWGKRCTKLLFMSDEEEDTLPAIGLPTKPGRNYLPMKTRLAFKYIYDHHLDDADWFLKADDDTFVIVENLRYMLSVQNTSEPVFFGHHFRALKTLHYFSGGGGYVLSKEALRRFANTNNTKCSRNRGAEDAEIGKCMHTLHVKIGDSRDKLGRSRFHSLPAHLMLHKLYPGWYLEYDQDNTTANSPSDYPISFHYTGKEKMHEMDYYAYHLSVYGIQRGLQGLN